MEIAVNRTIRTGEIDWGTVYQAFVGKVLNYFRYRLHDEELSEDLTAVTFEKVWVRRGQFRGAPEQIPAWIFTIARNVLRDHFRRSRYTLSIEQVAAVDDGPTLESHITQQENFALLVTLINRLPNRDRDLIALKFGAELTNRQIAALTQLSESNVGTILHRCVEKLRKEMGVKR